MREVPRRPDQIDRPVADHLVGDPELAARGIAGLAGHGRECLIRLDSAHATGHAEREGRGSRARPLFEGLSKRELTELARATDELTVAAGTVLCKEGSRGNEFFVIVDGTAEVTKNGEHLATRTSGDFVGEIALVATTTRTATVIATTPLRCFILTGREFRRVLDENRSVERKVMQALAERVLSTTGDPTL